jgi:hypothetical protein
MRSKPENPLNQAKVSHSLCPLIKKGKEKKKQNDPVKARRSIQNLDHAVVRADS